MRKAKRIILISVLLFAAAYLFYLFSDGVGRVERKRTLADLYVNGERLEMPAAIYWRGKSVLVQFPLYATLESLNCQVERERQEDPSIVTVRAGSHTFVIKENSFSSTLYENDRPIFDNLAQRLPYGGRGVKGQRYLDDEDYERVLKIFGFDQITCKIDEEARIVSLNAVGPKESINGDGFHVQKG